MIAGSSTTIYSGTRTARAVKVITPPVVVPGDGGEEEPPPPPPPTGYLPWAPPDTTGYRTFTLPPSGVVSGNGYTGTTSTGNQITLAANTDWVIKLTPNAWRDTIRIEGGRNVVIIGGRLRTTGGVALWMTSQTGIVHLEGLLVDNNTSPCVGDAFFLDSRSPTVSYRVQKCHMTGLRGNMVKGVAGGSITNQVVHADAIQMPCGADLRVAYVEAHSTMDLFFLRPDTGPIDSIKLDHVWADYYENTRAPHNPPLSNDLGTEGDGGVGFYLANTSGERYPPNVPGAPPAPQKANRGQWQADAIDLNECYYTTYDSQYTAAFPHTGTSHEAATATGSGTSKVFTFPRSTSPTRPTAGTGITGSIKHRAPAAPFCAYDEVYSGYVSPGYA